MTGHAADGMTDDGEGEGPTPRIAFAGYDGSLARLLTLARARRIDLSKIPVLDLADQLAAAMRDAAPATPLAQKGDWVVMAAWLLHLRSLLLLPADNLARKAASEEAERFRDRLSGLAEIQALAAWLDRRPRLGRDVFDRGEPPEGLGAIAETGSEIDVIEFLWASMALFDDGAPGPDVSETYRPPWRELDSVAAARARILTLLAETPAGRTLEALLPDEPAADGMPVNPRLRKRAAWSSTFIAGLELAKQGEVALAQPDIFADIHICPASAEPPS